MGVTVHYRGTIDDKTMVGNLADEMEDFAGSLGWKTQRWNEDWTKPNTARFSGGKGERRIIGHAPVQGITLYPHEHCEPFDLTFDPRGHLVDIVGLALETEGRLTPEEFWGSTKTQFAPIESHITIVKLLQYVKRRYVSNREVHDDGGYWESGDVHELQRRIDLINRSMDILESALSAADAQLGAAKSPEEQADAIERIIRKKFGG